MDRTLSFSGDPNIGVFSRVCEDIAVVPPEAPEEYRAALSSLLGVELIETTIQGSAIVGSLVAGNSRGIVVSGLATSEEIRMLEEHREVFCLHGRMNAAGNVILANNSFAVVHPDMPPKMAGEIGTVLGVPVSRQTFAGIKTVGMAAVATDRGVLVHPRSTRQEIEQLEQLTDLPVGTGTVNMGSGLVGSGLLANSRGYAAGAETSGYELGRMEDVFGFME
ncbi:MAG: translation initiation factor IF-6 [Methanoregulaceae archaeon]|nr:translation initiation factor IF-6 [Methanoregulaceae archaeon]